MNDPLGKAVSQFLPAKSPWKNLPGPVRRTIENAFHDIPKASFLSFSNNLPNAIFPAAHQIISLCAGEQFTDRLPFL